MKEETMNYAGWIDDLPTVSQRSLQRDDFAARKEAKDEAARRQDVADSAENQLTALRLAGQVPESLAEILARRSAMADRQAGKLDFQARRESGEVGLLDPVHRSRGNDSCGVIGRAKLAAERRRLDRRGQDAAEVIDVLQARRPPSMADAWTTWLQR
jgi:hypothetical protein